MYSSSINSGLLRLTARKDGHNISACCVIAKQSRKIFICLCICDTGVYYGSFFLNLRRGGGKNEIYGHLLCTDWGKDSISKFSPDDLCVTYSGSPSEGFTSTIWKKGSSYDETWYVFIDFACTPENVTWFEFAENTYEGNKEYLPYKPSIDNGYDFIFDVEYKSK